MQRDGKERKEIVEAPRWSTIKIVRGLGGKKKNSKFKEILQEISLELTERAPHADTVEEDGPTQTAGCGNSATLTLKGRKRKEGKTGLEVFAQKSDIPLDIRSNNA